MYNTFVHEFMKMTDLFLAQNNNIYHSYVWKGKIP